MALEQLDAFQRLDRLDREATSSATLSSRSIYKSDTHQQRKEMSTKGEAIKARGSCSRTTEKEKEDRLNCGAQEPRENRSPIEAAGWLAC